MRSYSTGGKGKTRHEDHPGQKIDMLDAGNVFFAPKNYPTDRPGITNEANQGHAPHTMPK